MVTTLTLDKAGRIVLPKHLRDELRLGPGQFLELESSGDKIILRRARRKARMYKKGGIWVLRTGVPLATRVVEDITHRVREEREQLALGKRRRNNVANLVRAP